MGVDREGGVFREERMDEHREAMAKGGEQQGVQRAECNVKSGWVESGGKGTITKSKNEFIYVILSSLNKIVRRVNDLDKFIEDLFGKLDKGIHSISSKLKILQENIIQLTNTITYKIPNEVLFMQVWKSRKTFPNITIETQQVYSCTSLPINIFERNNANIVIPLLTVPSYHQSDMEDSSSSDGSFNPFLYCSKFVKENIQTSEKHLQDKNLDHDSESKDMLQCQLVKELISVDHIRSSGSAVSHSYLDQSEGRSSFYIFPLNKRKPQEKSAVNILSGEKKCLHYNIEHMNNSRHRVLYGTGKGEVVLSQPLPLTDYTTDVFVNPLAPEAPPLPSDWLIQLTSSKGPSAPRVVSSISSPETSPLLVLETTTATTSACLKTTSKIDLKMSPEFTSTPESLECFELQPDDLSPRSQDQMIPPHLYPSVTSLSSKSWDSVVDVIDHTLASFPQSLKSVKSSPVSPSKSRAACRPLPQKQVHNTSGSSSVQLSRSSRVSHHSLSLSASSSPQTQISSNLSLSPKRSVSHLTKLIEAQSRSPMTYSPQSKLSCFTSTKVTTLQSTLSSLKSTSISSRRALAISQYAIVPPYADVKQNPPSILPILSKARKALMEAIRKGIQLHKTRENIPKGETEFPENEADIIRIRRKAMGYNSGKSDSETDWVE
ncbi:LOW QUALITY PROTEIN: uncharacterized protein LOC128116877 [Peromyscus californicus insignis]|uniref:LOW QUALITY PROTEIN: uncharacterized protein LOC128116877 n=1 Tax=Peromyscus californicus insignis TaxID=564181 RepID=UPI0022A6D909|nr:LOW QUALITY PROTEIN: uncharacterized protein LOC128116877 [Peromyscus californicus insignis]